MFYSKFSAFRICAAHGACNVQKKNIFAFKFQKFMAQVQAQTTTKTKQTKSNNNNNNGSDNKRAGGA